MRLFAYRDLAWAGRELRLGTKRGRVLATIEPDAEYPNLYRVRLPDGAFERHGEPDPRQGRSVIADAGRSEPRHGEGGVIRRRQTVDTDTR
jgi:hypothetical protein